MLLREVVFDAIVPASERAAELGCAQNLPEGFDGWFARCVARDIDKRFANAAEMYAGFLPLVGGERDAAHKTDILGKTAPLLPTPGDLPSIGAGPIGISRPAAAAQGEDAEQDAAAALPAKARGRKGAVAAAVAAVAVVLVAGALGVRSIIKEAENAAVRVVASVEQERQQEKDQAQTEELRKKLSAKRAEWDRVLGPMVVLPAGAFEMGADEEWLNEKPVHKVEVKSFEMDESEVTVAAWQICLGAGKCTAPATGDQCNWGRPERRLHPVNCVDFNQAKAFCEWAAKRLPTEEEWEYAARSVQGNPWPWGKLEPAASQACWKRAGDAGMTGTCPIAEAGADLSLLRVRGMAGNVHEWTDSAYCPYSRPGCEAQTRVVRGGSWRDEEPSALRAMARVNKAPAFQADDLGLRCVRGAL